MRNNKEIFKADSNSKRPLIWKFGVISISKFEFLKVNCFNHEMVHLITNINNFQNDILKGNLFKSFGF